MDTTLKCSITTAPVAGRGHSALLHRYSMLSITLHRTNLKWILLILCIQGTEQCRLYISKKPFNVCKEKNLRALKTKLREIKIWKVLIIYFWMIFIKAVWEYTLMSTTNSLKLLGEVLWMFLFLTCPLRQEPFGLKCGSVKAHTTLYWSLTFI